MTVLATWLSYPKIKLLPQSVNDYSVQTAWICTLYVQLNCFIGHIVCFHQSLGACYFNEKYKIELYFGVRKIVSDRTGAETRISDTLSDYKVSCLAEPHIRLNNLDTCTRYPCLNLITVSINLVYNHRNFGITYQCIEILCWLGQCKMTRV